jgi:hypothetical protein
MQFERNHIGWVEWRSKDVRNASMKALEQDDRMKTLVIPFAGSASMEGSPRSLTVNSLIRQREACTRGKSLPGVCRGTLK